MDEYKDITILKKQISDFKKSINSPNSDYMTGYLSAVSATEGIIAMLPTADVVEVKHGEWVHSSRGFDVSSDYECSICHSPSGIKHFYSGNMYLFCPDCGARMDGGNAE